LKRIEKRARLKAVDLRQKISHICGMARKIRKSIKISTLKQLCELQCTREEIAAAFSITTAQLDKLIEKDEAVREAINYGKTQGKISLRRSQFRLAKVNASMAIHLGKQYLGQTDKTQLEVSGPNGGPVETFDYSKLTPDERAALRETLQRATR